MTDKIVILSTCETEQEAERIARHLIDKRLAACVNISPKIRSIYRWKGAVEDAAEFLLLIKSRRDLLPRIRAEIAAIHTYEVPELLALPVVDGADAYLAWLDQELAE